MDADLSPMCSAIIAVWTAAGMNSFKSFEELTAAAAKAPVQSPSRWLSCAVGYGSLPSECCLDHNQRCSYFPRMFGQLPYESCNTVYQAQHLLQS
jgi:hypothetical protein